VPTKRRERYLNETWIEKVQVRKIAAELRELSWRLSFNEEVCVRGEVSQLAQAGCCIRVDFEVLFPTIIRPIEQPAALCGRSSHGFPRRPTTSLDHISTGLSRKLSSKASRVTRQVDHPQVV